MVTTVTDNSPQSINTSLFSLDKEVQEIKKTTDALNDKLSGINTESGVISVNGKQGIVELTASDVNALPSSTVIPTTTSELENTSGFITSSDSITGNAATATTADKAIKDSAGNTITTTYATKAEVPTKTSQLTNDSDYITSSGSITGNAATATTAATILDYNRNTPIKVRWGGPGIDSADWYPAFNADGSALEPINRTNIHAGTADKVANALTVNGKNYDGSSAVDAGVQTVANGGTGVTTQADINKAFISNLGVGTSDVTDGTEFVSSYASNNGFSAPEAVNDPFRRKFSTVWNYIKDKISSVLGLTKDNYGGKADTAGTADTVDNYHASQLWRSDGATWNPNANVVMTPSGNGSEWSFDFRDKNGATGSYWQVWDENKSTLLQVDADSGKVSAPYGFVGNLSGKADTAGTADRTTGVNYTGENDNCISAAQTPESYNNSSADWASYIICNHGNGTTYYHQMLRLPFFSDTIQLQRRVDGELEGWKNVAIIENENTWSGRQNFTTAKASNKMVIPIGAPSSLEDGCIWIG